MQYPPYHIRGKTVKLPVFSLFPDKVSWGGGPFFEIVITQCRQRLL